MQTVRLFRQELNLTHCCSAQLDSHQVISTKHQPAALTSAPSHAIHRMSRTTLNSPDIYSAHSSSTQLQLISTALSKKLSTMLPKSAQLTSSSSTQLNSTLRIFQRCQFSSTQLNSTGRNYVRITSLVIRTVFGPVTFAEH